MGMQQLSVGTESYIPAPAVVASPPVPSHPRGTARNTADSSSQMIKHDSVPQRHRYPRIVPVTTGGTQQNRPSSCGRSDRIRDQILFRALQDLAKASGFFQLPENARFHGLMDRRLYQKVLGHGMQTFEDLLVARGYLLTKTTDTASMTDAYAIERFQRYMPSPYLNGSYTRGNQRKNKVMTVLAAAAFIRNEKRDRNIHTERRFPRQVPDENTSSLVPGTPDFRNLFWDSPLAGPTGRITEIHESPEPSHGPTAERSNPSWTAVLPTEDIKQEETSTMTASSRSLTLTTKPRQHRIDEQRQQQYRIEQALLKIDKWATAWLEGELSDRTRGAALTTATARQRTGLIISTDDQTPELSTSVGSEDEVDDWHTFESCLALPDIVTDEDWLEDGEIMETIKRSPEADTAEDAEDGFVKIKSSSELGFGYYGQRPHMYAAHTTRSLKERAGVDPARKIPVPRRLRRSERLAKRKRW